MKGPSRSQQRARGCPLPGLLLALLLGLWSPAARAAPNDIFDMGSGGQPTITGMLGGSVSVSDSSLLSDLQVTVNFGEVSPLNRNAIVRVVIPIAIRSNDSYELRVSSTTTTGSGGALGLQPSDVGVGLQNLRPMGNGRICTTNRIAPLFNNDPAFTVNRTARATYPSTLANIVGNTLLVSGPDLSKGKVKPRVSDNGWLVDLVLTVVPQFFAPGTLSVTLNFTMNISATKYLCN